MATIKKALIVGGGVGGLTAAIALSRAGIQTLVVEKEARVAGVGITLTGATLRALDQIGMAHPSAARGWPINAFRMADETGRPIASNPMPAVVPGLPGAVGVTRPTFAALLMEHAAQSGAVVREGVTITSLDQDADGVDVAFTDGGRDRFDLVVGADGVFSSVRSMIFPDAPEPEYVGQGVWRFMTERHPEVDELYFFHGPKLKAGFIPLSNDWMYLLTTLNFPDNPRMDPARGHELYGEVLESFSAPLVREIRARMTQPDRVVWRPFETLLLPPPWHVGRVVLIGDAAHSMTPHLTSGGGMAIEDAVVLTKTLTEEPDVETALERFMTRRYDRVRQVCETSLAISHLEQMPEPSTAAVYGKTMEGYGALAEAF